AVVVLAVALVFVSYKHFKLCCEYEEAAQNYNQIKSVLMSNSKLKDCFVNPRKRAFLKKGGEYLPDYDNPRTLNDKVAYMLENYFLKSPITKIIGTKYLAKKYVAEVVGNEHVVKLFGAWDKPEDIDWDKLPNTFVLKSVRGNFGREVIVVQDKRKLNIQETVEKLKKFCSSPVMKSIKKNRIIAEELLGTVDKPLVDYKFFCSYGKPIVAYCLELKNKENTDVDTKTFSFYSIGDWKPLPIKADNHEKNNVPRPKHYQKMLEVASKLSKQFPLIRIDLYEIGDRVLVGEITEDASGAKSIMNPVIWDFLLGQNIKLPSKAEIKKMIEEDKRKFDGRFE
ncbi:MAG: hypothetical protein K6C34_05150, partial [Alphaproteobacteria bacterium]|nr:hypothetical protein [Alphaproteobacteria bacterium]